MGVYKEIRQAARKKTRKVSKALLLDANILIQAVLGYRVRRILKNYADSYRSLFPNRLLSPPSATLFNRPCGASLAKGHFKNHPPECRFNSST